jgi:hypothetical protein
MSLVFGAGLLLKVSGIINAFVTPSMIMEDRRVVSLRDDYNHLQSMYNIPRCTGINPGPPPVSRIAQTRNVLGIKDSSRDFPQLLSLVATVPKGFSVINGSDAANYPAGNRARRPYRWPRLHWIAG